MDLPTPYALLSGTSIQRSHLFDDWETVSVATAFGTVEVRRRYPIAVLNRHGFSNPLPPHAINYRANLMALHKLGAKQIVSLNSVGSLRKDLPPGSVVSCGDYVSFSPATFHDSAQSAFAPRLSNSLLPNLREISPVPITPDMVYVQTRGPRFETRAEVRILQSWGDVVGMTLAYEADLAQELGLEVTSLAIVDNFAHGLVDDDLSGEAFHQLVLANQEKVNQLLTAIVSHFSHPDA